MSRLQIPELLDEFSIRESIDYHKLNPGRKPLFVSRLYKALVGTFDESLKDIRSARGLRLHFAGSASRSRAHTNIPSPGFLKKIVFYANRTLITFPFHEVKRPEQMRDDGSDEPPPGKPFAPLLFGELKTRRGAAGGEVEPIGRAYSVDPADFDDFVALLCDARAAIEAGMVHVLPIFSAEDVKAIRRYRPVLLPANFRLSGLRSQFSEHPEPGRILVSERASVTGIYLPMFAEISLGTVIGLRRKEADAYELLQRKLEKLLYESGNETESTLLGYLQSVDEGVLTLNRKFKAALKEFWVKEALGAGKSGVVLMLAPLVGPAAALAAQVFAGSVTASEIIKPFHEYRKDLREVNESEFYLPWRIFRAQRRWFR